jgi:hypothetical protein
MAGSGLGGGAPPTGAGGSTVTTDAGLGGDSCTGTLVLGAAPLPATGKGPNGVAMADLNRDGKLDLVTVNDDEDTVSVFLGTGDGRFLAKVDYAVGSRPNVLALGDLDGDGTPDVVVVNTASKSVSVLLGASRGKLAAAVDYATGSGPWALALADLNGDGKLDVAVVGYDGVDVLLGAGGGKLGAKVHYNSIAPPEAVAIADMNGDHKLDIVVITWSSSLSIRLGNGDGTFSDEVTDPAGDYSTAGAVGDLDGTGGLDVVTINTNEGDGNGLSVVLSTGGGKLAAPVDYPTGGHAEADNPYYSPGGVNSPESVVLADVNADGKLDVIEANCTSGTVSVLLGTGGGKLAPKVDYATGGSPRSVAAGDLNGDGKLDLAITNGDANTVEVLLGKGDGTFGADIARLDHPIGIDTTGGPSGT